MSIEAIPEWAEKAADELLGVGFGRELQEVRATMRGQAIRALLAAEQRGFERAKALVEQAFRDGLAYGSNTENADPDVAWEHSRVRKAMQEGK